MAICDPLLVKNIMIKDFEYFGNRVGGGNFFGKGKLKTDQVWQKQLSMIKGQEWKYLR